MAPGRLEGEEDGSERSVSVRFYFLACSLVAMGNKLGKRRYVVDEKYTRPQGLYQHMDVDRKKLRKLILDSKLAPCYPGDEESTLDLEECPICFLVSIPSRGTQPPPSRALAL